MNISEIVIGNKKLLEHNNDIAVVSPYNNKSSKTLYINEIYINGKILKLNASKDGLELGTKSINNKVKGSLFLNQLVTDTFVLQDNMVLIPLIIDEQMKIIYEDEQYILQNNIHQIFLSTSELDNSLKQHNLVVYVIGKIKLHSDILSSQRHSRVCLGLVAPEHRSPDPALF